MMLFKNLGRQIMAISPADMEKYRKEEFMLFLKAAE
jgi:hypothetical protein